MIERLREFHRRTGASHFASSASCLPVLLEVKSRMKPGDVCILSKAHAVTAYNLVFDIPMDEAPVQGEFGSLGSGLPFALGVAKMRPENTVYVVVGDGEMQEGSCWEAILVAERLGIFNIRVFIDLNGMQGMGECPSLGEDLLNYLFIYDVVTVDTEKGDSWESHYRNA